MKLKPKIACKIAEWFVLLKKGLQRAVNFFLGILIGKIIEKEKINRTTSRIHENQNKNDVYFERLKHDESRRLRLLDHIRKNRSGNGRF